MNHVVLIGRLTRDPELRYVSGSGTAVSQFTLAVDKQLSRDKKQQFEQQGKPTADFIRIVVWGKQAENCANYLKKGRLVAVHGSINVSSYKNNNGETRYSTDVVANNVQFLEWGDRNNDNRSNVQRRQNNQSNDDFAAFDKDFSNDYQSIEDDDDIPF